MSKDAILGAIRRGLRRGALPEDQQAMLRGRLAAHPRHLIPARSRLPRPGQVALFIANVEKEFGTVDRLPDLAAVPGAVADYLARHNLPPRLVVAPHPEVEALDWSSRPLLETEARRARDGDLVSLQHGFAGVAETGTILFPSDPARPATLNLLPDTHMVLLRASRVVGAYEEAWDLLRAERADPLTGGFMPRNLMMVTGPSRSADIEQTLELGAHGPRRLHVLLVEDEPAARLTAREEERAQAVAQVRAGDGPQVRAGDGPQVRAGDGLQVRAGDGLQVRAGDGLQVRAGDGLQVRAGDGPQPGAPASPGD